MRYLHVCVMVNLLKTGYVFMVQCYIVMLYDSHWLDVAARTSICIFGGPGHDFASGVPNPHLMPNVCLLKLVMF